MTKKFCVGTNFKDELLYNLHDIEKKYIHKNIKISEIYGSFATSLLGSARPSFCLPKVTPHHLKKHIQKANKFGFEFNYLINSPCLGNIEWTYSGRKKIIDFISYLIDLDIKKITITTPHIIEIIKKRYPDLKITTSVISCIDSVEKAKLYEASGADIITLDFSINRNFPLLKEIRKEIKSELQVLLNDLCLLKCPMKQYHYDFVGHSTQEYFKKNKYFVDDPFIEKCCYLRLKNIEEFIKAGWIRPEDVDEYSKVGIDYFKISSREFPTKDILTRVEAYLSGNYSGNFVSITNFFPLQFKNEEKLYIEIDNKSLSSFLKYFLDGNCNFNCSFCNYCKEIANKVVKIDSKKREKYLKLFEDMFEKRLYIDLDEKVDISLVLDYNLKYKLKNFLKKIFKK